MGSRRCLPRSSAVGGLPIPPQTLLTGRRLKTFPQLKPWLLLPLAGLLLGVHAVKDVLGSGAGDFGTVVSAWFQPVVFLACGLVVLGRAARSDRRAAWLLMGNGPHAVRERELLLQPGLRPGLPVAGRLALALALPLRVPGPRGADARPLQEPHGRCLARWRGRRRCRGGRRGRAGLRSRLQAHDGRRRRKHRPPRLPGRRHRDDGRRDRRVERHRAPVVSPLGCHRARLRPPRARRQRLRGAGCARHVGTRRSARLPVRARDDADRGRRMAARRRPAAERPGKHGRAAPGRIAGWPRSASRASRCWSG